MSEEIPFSERPTPPDAPSSVAPPSIEELQEEVQRRITGLKGMVRTQREVLESHEDRIDVLERKLGAFEDGLTPLRVTLERTAMDVSRLAEGLSTHTVASDGLEDKVDRLLGIVTALSQLLDTKDIP